MNTKTTIAAFDFDGTITTRDSLLPFLLFTYGKLKTFQKLIPLTPLFIKYLMGLAARQETKEAILAAFFGGMPRDKLLAQGKAYASSDRMKRLLKTQAIERLDWHKKQGHKCIIVSASVDAYLPAWGELMGFDDVICSRLAYDHNGLVTGKLLGKNCWGPEKPRRLLELAGPKEGFFLYAYGDSRGDKELLELADFPFYCRGCRLTSPEPT